MKIRVSTLNPDKWVATPESTDFITITPEISRGCRLTTHTNETEHHLSPLEHFLKASVMRDEWDLLQVTDIMGTPNLEPFPVTAATEVEARINAWCSLLKCWYETTTRAYDFYIELRDPNAPSRDEEALSFILLSDILTPTRMKAYLKMCQETRPRPFVLGAEDISVMCHFLQNREICQRGGQLFDQGEALLVALLNPTEEEAEKWFNTFVQYSRLGKHVTLVRLAREGWNTKEKMNTFTSFPLEWGAEMLGHS